MHVRNAAVEVEIPDREAFRREIWGNPPAPQPDRRSERKSGHQAKVLQRNRKAAKAARKARKRSRKKT